MLAKDIMTRHVICCSPDTSLREVAQLMADNDCGCLPVTENASPQDPILGIITDRDLVCRALAAGLDPDEATAATAMTAPAATISEGTSVDDVVDRLTELRIRRLVVVDGRGCCSGIITQGDIARVAEPEETGEMVQQVSQPDAGTGPERTLGSGSSISQGALHSGGGISS